MMMTVADLIDSAISYEIEARDIYTGLAELSAAYPALHGFWQHMAVDESSHAALLRSVRVSMPDEGLARTLEEAEIEMVDSVARELSAVRGLSASSFDDAYEIAHRLESSEINSIFRILVLDGLDSSSTDSLVEAQFNEHLERIKDMGRRLDRAYRRSIELKR